MLLPHDQKKKKISVTKHDKVTLRATITIIFLFAKKVLPMTKSFDSAKSKTLSQSQKPLK